MRGNFRQLLKRFCLKGSVLGLKYFYLYPDRVSRCFWAVTLLLVLQMASILGVFLYRRFEEMPTRITIENQHEPLHNLPHPAIAICSPNQISMGGFNHLKKNIINGNLSFDLKNEITQLLGFNEVIDDLNLDRLKRLQDIFEVNRYTTSRILTMLPQRCSDFLRFCYFERKIYNCSELFYPIQTKTGTCCAFNSLYYLKNYERNEKKPNFIARKVTRTGRANSLTVITDYNLDDALDGTVTNDGATRILFTDSTVFPVADESTLLSPRAEYFHMLSATYTYCSEEVRQLPVSSRKCYFTDEFALPHFTKYHPTDCKLSCFIREVEEQCHCTLPYVPFVDLRKACNLISLPCIQKVKVQMFKVYQNELCHCIRNCESRTYRAELVTGNLNAIKYNIFSSIYSDIVVNDSTTVIHFYFPYSVYVKRKQETVMSLINLAANLGGVFGLSVGCSIISLIEIGFFLYLAIKNYIRKRLNMKKRNRINFIN